MIESPFALCLVGIVLFLFILVRLGGYNKGKVGEWIAGGKIESLIKRNKNYRSFNSIILKTPDGTTQIDHILISPYGIFVIEIKNLKGWIFGGAHQKKWTQSLRRGYRWHNMFNKYKFQFQNPVHQNYKHVKAVQKFLGVDSKIIFNLVVFVGDSEFMTEMPENVMKLDEFLPIIKSRTAKILSDEKVERYTQKLRDYINNASIKEDDHIRNIEQNLRNPICPRCGKAMVLRTVRKGVRVGSEFWGCVNFPSCRVTRNVV